MNSRGDFHDRGQAPPGGLAPSDFDEVYDRFRDDIYRFVRYLDGNQAEAEDLFQEVWLRVARHLGERPDPAGLKPWLLAIALNLHRDSLRKKRVRRLFLLSRSRGDASESAAQKTGPASSDDPVYLAEQAVLRRKIDQAVRGLPERQRQIFVLQEVEGLRQAEIAGVLGIPVGTVKSLMFRAVRRLQKELADCRPGLGKVKCDVKMLSV
jgi:RNA polymerase sigma-70 factor (ECF subfamily)